MDSQLNEVSQDFARLKAAFTRNDFNICNNLLSLLEGKMKAAQDYNQARDSEFLSNIGFLMVTMLYAIQYFLYAAFLGKKNTRVMTCLNIWTVVLMLLLLLQIFIFSLLRFRFSTLKVMRLVMAGLFFVSSSFVLVLLQLGLWNDEV